MSLSPKGSIGLSYAENSQDFRNASLTNVRVAITSQNYFKKGTPKSHFLSHLVLIIKNVSLNPYVMQNMAKQKCLRQF